jgi:sugar-specific transcriptional regulator TrmB
MPDYLGLLRSVGLNESEANIYLTSLESGPAPAQVLVKKSGFSRPAAYQAIDLLMQKGLFSSVLRGKRHVYTAEPPERLVHYASSYVKKLETKVGEISEAVGDLKLLQHGERPLVKFYEGVQGLKTILQDIVDSKPASTEEIANLDAVKEIFSTAELRAIQNILVKQKAKGRALLMGEVSQTRKGTETRVLPKGFFPFYGDLVIYGDKLAMVSFKGKIIGVVIESKILADTHRALFELAWKGAQTL